jgi:hypothetical protein
VTADEALKRIWKEVVEKQVYQQTCFELLSQHAAREAKEMDEKYDSELQASKLKSDPGAS